jgi:hypothetical protein
MSVVNVIKDFSNYIMGTNVNCHIPLQIWKMADVTDVIKYLIKFFYTSQIKIEFVFIKNLTLLFQLKFYYASYEQVFLCRRIKLWASLKDTAYYASDYSCLFWPYEWTDCLYQSQANCFLPKMCFLQVKQVYFLFKFKVCKSVHHHTIQINHPTWCNNFPSLLLDVYVRINMFRASSRPSSGAQQLQ